MERIVVRTPVEFGHAVKRCRRGRGWTQVDLATRVGVGRRWVNELESGKHSVELGLVLRTVATLGLELEMVEFGAMETSLLDEILDGDE